MAEATVVTARSAPRSTRGSAAEAVLRRNSYALMPIALGIGLFIANTAVSGEFLAQSGWAVSIATLCPILLAGLAQALPVLSGGGGLDLSVGPFIGFITVLIAGVLTPDGLAAPWLLVPVVLLCGLAAGAVNGALIAFVRLPPIIATLGTYLFYSGISTEILPSPGGAVPLWLVDIEGSYGSIPGLLIVLVLVAIGWTSLSRTAYFRNLLAVGCDERAAFTAGVNVARVRVWTYAFGGLLAALAGLALSGLLQGGDGTVGTQYTLTSVTAVALGGIALTGGRGGMLGAAVGGAALFMIQSLLTAAHVSVFEVDIVNGLVLLFALALQSLLTQMIRRGRARRRLRRGVVTNTVAA